MNLTFEERTKIFDKVCHLVETKHFDPSMNGADWNALAKNRQDQILASANPEAFEKEVQNLVAELKTSHTGFRGTKPFTSCLRINGMCSPNFCRYSSMSLRR